jgi:hypothetical protein
MYWVISGFIPLICGVVMGVREEMELRTGFDVVRRIKRSSLFRISMFNLTWANEKQC